MTKYERHPAPEKLLLQITTEAVNLLAWGPRISPRTYPCWRQARP